MIAPPQRSLRDALTRVARRWACWLLGLGLLLRALVSPAAVSHASEPDEIDVIVNARSQVVALSGNQLEAIYTRSMTRWDDGTTIVPFNLADDHSARHRFDRAVLRLSPQQVGRFWLDHRIRGLGAPPRQAPDAALLVKVIERLAGGVGYVPLSQVRPTVRVVARVINGAVVAP